MCDQYPTCFGISERGKPTMWVSECKVMMLSRLASIGDARN